MNPRPRLAGPASATTTYVDQNAGFVPERPTRRKLRSWLTGQTAATQPGLPQSVASRASWNRLAALPQWTTSARLAAQPATGLVTLALRPEHQRRGRRGRWLLCDGSHRQVRLQGAADHLESKHNDTPVRVAKRGCGLAGDGGDGRRHGRVSQLATSGSRGILGETPALTVAGVLNGGHRLRRFPPCGCDLAGLLEISSRGRVGVSVVVGVLRIHACVGVGEPTTQLGVVHKFLESGAPESVGELARLVRAWIRAADG